MIQFRASLAAAVVLAGCVSVPALASPMQVCVDREKLLKQVEDKYGEKPAGFSVTDGDLFEILISPSGSWTVIQTLPNKPRQSCPITAGHGASVPDRGEML